jgi:anti-sigma B factor antagonist
MSALNDFVVEKEGDATVIVPGPRLGSLDNADIALRRGSLIEAVREQNASQVIVDFSKVEYFGSLLLDTLCVVWKQVRQRSGTMVLCNVSGVANEILSQSKLNSLWPIYESRQAAIAAKAPPQNPRAAMASRDSKIERDQRDDPSNRLEVRETGRRTVVGFSGGDLPPEYVLSRYLEQITRLIDDQKCEEFAFDMAGVSIVPSGFLGVVASILQKGVHVSVRNPSTEIREVLALTNFDSRVHVEQFT